MRGRVPKEKHDAAWAYAARHSLNLEEREKLAWAFLAGDVYARQDQSRERNRGYYTLKAAQESDEDEQPKEE